MKKILFLLVLGAFLLSALAFADDWKGESDASQAMAGGLAGLAVIDNNVGFTLIGDISKKILNRGFVPDINDSVSIEALLGPAFISGSTALVYAARLRWDFQRDERWTLYALGGLAGDVTGQTLGNHTELYPHFGVGAFLKMTQFLRLRAELSHEFFVAGLSVAI